MQILKFGGSSLATAERIAAVVDILVERKGATKLAVVVSAMGGVTDTLAEAAQAAARGTDSYRQTCQELSTRHLAVAEALAPADELEELRGRIKRRLSEVEELLHGVYLVRESSARSLDLISSYGERLSADLVAAALHKRGVEAGYIDARHLIVTDADFGAAHVRMEPTNEKIRQHFGAHEALQVVTGFLGATDEGETTTLGRGGSDYTASLLGGALEAALIEIWTDVDGVMSADPRLVPDAFSLPALGYEELMELSHFGAKVVYPPTIHPARTGRIPLVIRNTFHPERSGTRVANNTPAGDSAVRGIASIHDVALMRLEGDGMLGVPGVARRLFDALGRENVNVVLITQGSSEHSICFAVSPDDVARARKSVEEEFVFERRGEAIDPLVVERDLSVIAVVGAAMRERPGIAGRVFSVLGSEGVNVRAIAQGSSELNISLVISRDDETRALRAMHRTLFSRTTRCARLFVLGAGGVGSALLSQLAREKERIQSGMGLELRLCGLANSRHMALSAEGIDPESWREALDGGEASDLDAFAERCVSSPGPRLLVDITANPETAALYRRVLPAGVAVVSTNKLPFTASLKDFEALVSRPGSEVKKKSVAAQSSEAGCSGARMQHDFRNQTLGRGAIYYETTAGAALPVVQTLRRLLETGDRLRRVEGVFSGTLSFLFHQVRSGKDFASAVREAHERGYTEPDPREDLRGMDVARKLLILARTAGLPMELDDITVAPLLPEELRNVPLDAFWKGLSALSEDIQARHERARANSKTLVYLASLDEGSATVGLADVDPLHPAASLEGTENVFVFTTERYQTQPLVIRGAGAGPEVTACGVFADILQACRENG